MPSEPAQFKLSPLPNLPVPNYIAPLLGYAGSARWLGCCWTIDDHVVLTDGQREHEACWLGWHGYFDWAVDSRLPDYNLGQRQSPVKHMLVIDLAEYRAYIGELADALAFLQAQWGLSGPPLELRGSGLRPLTEQERALLKQLGADFENDEFHLVWQKMAFGE